MDLRNADAERSLLGAILIDAERVLLKITDILDPADFSQIRHQHIYEAFIALYGERKSIDIVTLSERLKIKGFLEDIGGNEYIVDLASELVTTANVVEYAQIVSDLAARRKLIATIAAITEETSIEESVDALIQKAETAIFAVGKMRVKDSTSSLAEILSETMTRMDALQGGTLKRGMSTGYREVDHILTGLQNSDLIIIAARPAMGKTAYALNLARNIAINQRISTLVFSLEMSKDQLVDRLLSMETGISTERLRSGQLNEGEMSSIMDTMGKLGDSPLYIDDTPNVTIQTLRTRARREAHKHHLGLIIVDYLQLMSGLNKKGRSDNREQEISEISRGLKIIARELNVPVVALSQLSRQVEARSPQIPQLSDLRESGSIEQNADIVAFLYRDDYYNLDSPRQNMTDLLIRKHRNGRIGSVEMYFDRTTQTFRGVNTL